MNRISIDPERVISDIDRNIFGGFMDIWWQDPGFGYLDSSDSPRSDLRTALQRVNFSNMRWPGGNKNSGYRWIDGVGPRENRPARHDLAMHRIVSNYYGTNEFLRFCHQMNIEPQLGINCGDGDMREAADWVEYCNGTGNTALANLRQKHGFTKPHNVKYWAIGNEVDSPGQIGYKTPQEYARAYSEFSKVMKRIDPNIKLIASAVCSWEDHPLGPQFLYRETEWVERTQLMLEQAGDRIDYLALHRYDHLSADESFENFMAFGTDLNERLSAYEGLIHAVSMERGIKHAIGIAVDEWSPGRQPIGSNREVPISIARDERGVMHLSTSSSEVHNPRGRNAITLEDALVTGLYLNAFIRHANSVRMAIFMPIPTGGFMSLAHPEKPLVLQTIFYPFELYSRTCGQLALDVFWKGDTFSGTYGNRTHNGIRTLDVSATLDEAQKKLAVYVVNQSKDKAMETTISLISGDFAGNINVFVINGPDTRAENTEDEPDQVITRESVMRATGKSLTCTFEPHSVTALVCEIS